MNDGRTFCIRASLALAVGAVIIVACVAFVDRPTATFVHDRGFSRDLFLKWFTYPPPIVQNWTPAILTLLAVRRCFGPWRRWHATLFFAGVSLVIADQFRESLSFVFGRYWPETWIDNNPSYIGDGAYGFHFFHGGRAYESFPSGHTARTAAAASVYWTAYPRSRPICSLALGIVAVGLIGMNYHFVSDVIAGGLIGALVGGFAVRLAGIDVQRDAAEIHRASGS